MLVHSPLDNTKSAPKNRRVSKSRKENNHKSHFKEGRGMIYSPHVEQQNHYVNDGRKKSEERSIKLPKIKPWKIILGSVFLGLIGLLYLTQIFQTQKIYQEVNALQRKYNSAEHTYMDAKYTYDRITGPAEVYHKAKQMGLVNGGPPNQVIIIKQH